MRRLLNWLQDAFIDHTGLFMATGSVLFIALLIGIHEWSSVGAVEKVTTDAERLTWAIYFVAIAIFTRSAPSTSTLERNMERIECAIKDNTYAIDLLRCSVEKERK